MNESFFKAANKKSEEEENIIKASNGLTEKVKKEKLNLNLPADKKDKYVQYCKSKYITPSAQLIAWIDEFID